MHHKLTQKQTKPQWLARALAGLAVLAIAGLALPTFAQADPILFDSIAQISFFEENGGVHYYDFEVSSLSLPYHEVYLVMDTDKVVHGGVGAMSPDLVFVSADLTHVNGTVLLPGEGIDLFFSQDGRALANINNPRLLDSNEMDTYDPDLTDPLPTDTHSLAMRLGFNRELHGNEAYQLGYWVGDLRGMIDPNEVFTESDGTPIPEPATLVLALGGLTGLYGAHRRRRKA